MGVKAAKGGHEATSLQRVLNIGQVAGTSPCRSREILKALGKLLTMKNKEAFMKYIGMAEGLKQGDQL